MVNNKKVYSKLLLLIIVVLAIMGTQSLAATVSKVTGLKSEVVSSTEVKISWNKLSNVTGYEVYIKESGRSYSSIGKTNLNSNVKINNLTAGKTYYVKVRAYNGNIVGDFSNEIRISTTNSSSTTLGKVSNLKLNSVTTNTANITWNKVTNATGYEVYVKEQNGSYVNRGRTTNLYTTLNGLTAGKTYYVKVRAYNGSNVGDFSNELRIVTTNSSSTTLGKVSNLRLNSVTTNTADIAWNGVSNATGYEVYVKEQNGSYVNRGRTTNLYTTLNGLTAGKTYYVKVRAYNGSNVGDFSNELRIVTTNSSSTTLGKVSNLRLNSVTTNTANIAWNKVTNATGYEVYVKEQNGSYVNRGRTTNLYTTLNGLTAGKTYYVKVRAYNGSNVGDFSNELRIVTTNSSSTTLGKVSNLRLNSVTTNTADIAWNGVSNATGYEVYVRVQSGSYTNKGKTANLYTTLRGLAEGTTYEIKVRAYRIENGKTLYGEFSDELRFSTTKQNTTPEITLGKVTNLKATLNGTKANLSWNSIANADGYEVYIDVPGKGYISLGKVTKNSVGIIGLEAGKSYNVKIRAYKGSIVGEFSDEVEITTQNEITMGKVENLNATVTGTTARLTWDAVTNATQYEVFINIPGRGYISLGTTRTNSVKVISLSNGVTYQIKIRAIGTIDGRTMYGDYSNEVSVIAK